MSRARDIANLINVAPSIYATDDEAVLKELVDAKGDLITGTADDTVGRLAVGTNGHLLSAASGETAGMQWVAPPEGGLVHIDTQTDTAVSAIDVTSCFSVDYNRYYIAFDLIGSTTSQELRFRFLDVTTPHTSGNHRVQQLYAASTSIQGFRNTTYTYWSIGSVLSTDRQFSQLTLINPFETLKPSGVSQYLELIGGNITLISYGNACDTTTSFNGCRIFPAAGTITGSVSVYGFKE